MKTHGYWSYCYKNKKSENPKTVKNAMNNSVNECTARLALEVAAVKEMRHDRIWICF